MAADLDFLRGERSRRSDKMGCAIMANRPYISCGIYKDLAPKASRLSTLEIMEGFVSAVAALAAASALAELEWVVAASALAELE